MYSKSVPRRINQIIFIRTIGEMTESISVINQPLCIYGTFKGFLKTFFEKRMPLEYPYSYKTP